VQRDLTAFGAELRRRRVVRGLSLRVMARRLGLSSHSGLVDYEQGRRLVPAHLLEAFAQALDDGDGELRRLRDRVLASRADPAPASVEHERIMPTLPFPAVLSDFVGRDRELAETEAWLARPTAAARVLVVSGPPGIGKTSIAVHLAHRLAQRCPDTLLYLNLRGSGPSKLDTGQALHRLLSSLGLSEAKIPADHDDRAALLRAVLYGRRALLLLDDVADERQVRPLLPGGPATITVITSRNPLAGIDGARHVPLSGLAPENSVELLAEVIGPGRVAAEPDAAHDLVEHCAGLPLATRILAARLATWQHRRLADCVHDLAAAEQRLDWLQAGDRSVRGVLTASYDALPDPVRRLFRRLALVPGRHFGVDAAAAALDTSPATAAPLLRVIADVGLIQAAPTPDRHRFHDLVALFAQERLNAEETPADRDRVLADLVAWVLTTADQAGRQLDPSDRTTADSPFRTLRAATRWLDEEIDTVANAIRHAAAAGRADLVHPLMVSLPWYFDLGAQWRALEELGTYSLTLAVATGDPRQETVALNCLSLAYRELRRPAVAIRYSRRARRLARTIGDVREEGTALDRWGHALITLGRPGDAVPILREAVSVLAAQPHRWHGARARNHLGRALRESRHHDEAVAQHKQAIAVFRELGAVRSEGLARTQLGDTLAEAGRLSDAVAQHVLACELFERGGDEWGQALALHGLATTRFAQGQHVEAIDCLRRAERLFDRQHDPHQRGDTRRLLARIGQRPLALAPA
jgi:tetratricopeptide (TPR) repeat protein/transcriptional regulator with XRE-family HTH domain